MTNDVKYEIIKMSTAYKELQDSRYCLDGDNSNRHWFIDKTLDCEFDKSQLHSIRLALEYARDIVLTQSKFGAEDTLKNVIGSVIELVKLHNYIDD